MRRSTPLCAFLMLLAALASSGLAAPADRAVQLLLEKAQSLEGRGRLDMAAEAWRQVLLADPDQPDALAGLAKAARQEGRAEEAEQYLARLRQTSPGHPALSDIEAVKALGPYQARLDEAVRLDKDGQYEAAMRIYREVFGDAPPPGGWAIAYYETLAATADGSKQAADGLRRLTERYPDAADYKLSLGKLLSYRPETRREGMRVLASSARARGAPAARQSWRQALIWSGPSPDSLESLDAYLARYEDPELLALRTEAAAGRAKPGPVAGRELELGYKALQSEKLEEAEKSFRAALDKAPNSSKALAGLGFVRMKQERFRAAVELLTTADASAPGDDVILDALATARFWTAMDDGKAAMTEGRTAAAATAYQAALALRPEDADALRGPAGS